MEQSKVEAFYAFIKRLQRPQFGKEGEVEKYLNTPIKDIIKEFPKIGEILDEYGVGCVTCSAGSCLLKDIIEVHNLTEKEEKEVMERILKVIYPERVFSISAIERKTKIRSKEISYSPPIKKLVDEHTIIKRWIALIPAVLDHLDVESDESLKTIYDGADFIRNFADKFHHAKEEDILFKYFDENLEIVKTMLDDHEKGRSYVKSLIESLEMREKEGIFLNLMAYRDLLSEHIKKEDEILYPWMDRNLSINQVGQLYSKFNEVDEKKGDNFVEKYTKFIIDLEKKYQKKEVKK